MSSASPVLIHGPFKHPMELIHDVGEVIGFIHGHAPDTRG